MPDTIYSKAEVDTLIAALTRRVAALEARASGQPGPINPPMPVGGQPKPGPAEPAAPVSPGSGAP